MSRRIWMSAVLAATIACAGNPAPSAESSGPAERRRDNVITAQELSAPEIVTQNLLEAVRRLRPNYLASRGGGTPGNPKGGRVQVSIDGSALGEVSNLTSYSPAAVREIRYFTANEAAQKWGTTANGGAVIMVTSK